MTPFCIRLLSLNIYKKNTQYKQYKFCLVLAFVHLVSSDNKPSENKNINKNCVCDNKL